MTQTFLVGSAVVPMPPVEIQGTGDNTVTALRSALVVARTLKHIPQPVPLNDRRALVMMRKWVDERWRELIRSVKLNGNSPMCFDNRNELYQFD